MSVGPRRLGNYELRELLGRGGISEVWKALDTQSQRYVTIKLLRPNLQNDPNFLVRFDQEAQKVASLHHPNIVHVHDFQVVHPQQSESTLTYLVMDYIENTQLGDYIHATSAIKKFPAPNTIVQLFASISAAIDYAHQHGVIHRNINPTNILLDVHNTSRNPIGEPLLIDFGIAAILGLPSSPRPGTFQGNPGYMAPEQVQGYPGNELSDIYSLGVILYELCTGAQPFQADNPTHLMAQHVNTTPTPPALFHPNIPPPLTLVLLRSLEKEPARRFASAWAMTVALADALNVLVPEDLRLPVPSIDAMDLPTYLTPSHLNLPAEVAPPTWLLAGSSSSQPAAALFTPPGATPAPSLSPAVLATPASSVSPSRGQNPAMTPAGDIAGAPPDLAAPASSKATAVFPPASTPKRRGLMVALIGMALLLIGAAALGVFYLLPHTNSATASPTRPQIVGHAFFVSSGQVGENTNLGINDGIKITLQNIAAPTPGKGYYAWLLSDNNAAEAASILLGQLPVIHGKANLLYNDKGHRDLLTDTNRLLITEEDAHTTPLNPSLDKNTWRYLAGFPQTLAPNTKYSLLDHLRHLLSGDPQLDALGLHGGLASGLVRNIEKVMIWSGSARDYWQSKNTQLMRAQLIRILDVLDSAVYVQAVGDVPPGTPLLINNRVALLELDPQNQVPPGYLDHTGRHLRGLINSPGATRAQIKLAREINNTLNNVRHWLEQVRKDAVQLEQIRDDTQLLSQASLSTLNDMAAQALYAYVGQLDPTTNQVMKGAVQMHNDLERLATLDITPYGRD